MFGILRNRNALLPPAKVVSMPLGNLGGCAMGDTDKNIIEKLVDTINDVVETATITAADALNDAMEPDPVPESDKAKEIKEGREIDRQGTNNQVATK
jgi:hypothetical protein